MSENVFRSTKTWGVTCLWKYTIWNLILTFSPKTSAMCLTNMGVISIKNKENGIQICRITNVGDSKVMYFERNTILNLFLIYFMHSKVMYFKRNTMLTQRVKSISHIFYVCKVSIVIFKKIQLWCFKVVIAVSLPLYILKLVELLK